MGGGGREKGAVTARGSATAAFARRWRPSCGGPWGRASGTTYSCPATSAAPTAKPRGFANQLWKQVDHLGNAGFDPVLFRVDTDAASPLAWDVHHWFPCARGGTTVQSNIRIMQLQASRKKHNKLEFLKWRAFAILSSFTPIIPSNNLCAKLRKLGPLIMLE